MRFGRWSIEWVPLARDTVGKQLIRAADSIGANIAEGVGQRDISRQSAGSFEWPEDRSMKQNIGCAALTDESS